MDPLTQGILGATLPQASNKSEHSLVAGLLGFLSGMAADLDVLIRSNTDPLLFLEYHRQFSHALVFIPVGGLICATVLYHLLARRWSVSFKRCWLYCTLGYATHALLDACTTYGTQLFWPFSDIRIAWNTMSIIDPLYTLPLVLLVLLSALKKNNRYAQMALIWALSYPMLGLIQRDRAEQAGLALTQQRQHIPIRLEAKPSFANLLLWKVVYETEDRFYIDAIRVGTSANHYEGESVSKLNLAKDFSWLKPDMQQAKDIERFRWFSNGYIARDPSNLNRIIDVRFSLVPNEAEALWAIELSPAAKESDHVSYITARDMSQERTDLFKRMLFNR